MRIPAPRAIGLIGATVGLLLLAGCQSSTSKAPPTPTHTLVPPNVRPSATAVAVTFTGCGSAPAPTPTPSSTQAIPTVGGAATSEDALNAAYDDLAHNPAVAHSQITCGVKLMAASALTAYLPFKTTPPGNFYVVVAKIQPSGGAAGKVDVYFITTTLPAFPMAEDTYPATLVPDIFQGI